MVYELQAPTPFDFSGKQVEILDFYVMHVQPIFAEAIGNTKYLMLANLNIAQSGTYDFKLLSDDDFELYIDCNQIATGLIGRHTFSTSILAGTRQFIIRYKNIPDKTPGYAGFAMYFNGTRVYQTRAAGWKGQANVIGDIEWV